MNHPTVPVGKTANEVGFIAGGAVERVAGSTAGVSDGFSVVSEDEGANANGGGPGGSGGFWRTGKGGVVSGVNESIGAIRGGPDVGVLADVCGHVLHFGNVGLARSVFGL